MGDAEGAGTASGGGRHDTVADVLPGALSSHEQYGALVQPYLGAVVHLAAALVGPADAEDAAQEAILRGMQAWSALHDERALKSWLLRIAYNVCMDLKRGRVGTHQRRTQPLPEANDGALVVPLGGDLGSDLGGSDHAAALDLRAAVNALDAGLRAVVVLRYYVGMDATAIGTVLRLPLPRCARGCAARWRCCAMTFTHTIHTIHTTAFLAFTRRKGAGDVEPAPQPRATTNLRHGTRVLARRPGGAPPAGRWRALARSHGAAGRAIRPARECRATREPAPG